MKYKIGTRGSQLSLAQTNFVINDLKKTNPDSEFEIIIIKTKGDIDSRPLFTIDQKGIFEKEIDHAVATGQIDFAVHSLKDVPSNLPKEIILACVPKRETANDVIISKDCSNLHSIVSKGIVGTSSLRRAVQVKRKRPDLKVKPIRGNIETRIRKIADDSYDAIILAQAGILRLGMDIKYSKLSIDDFSPSPGQGALAIISRVNDSQSIKMLKKIEDAQSRIEIEAERALSDYIDSGCMFPIGAYARTNGEQIILKVAAFSVDGKKSIIVEKTGSKYNPKDLGRLVSQELQKQGINELALNWREKVTEWNIQ